MSNVANAPSLMLDVSKKKMKHLLHALLLFFLALSACTNVEEKKSIQLELERITALIEATEKEIAPYRTVSKGSGISKEERAALTNASLIVYELREQGLDTKEAEADRSQLEVSTMKAIRERERKRYEALKEKLEQLLTRKTELEKKI